MNLNIDPSFLVSACLAFFRIGGILFALPIFGDSMTPIRVRILLSIALTYALSATIAPISASAMPTSTLTLGIALAGELMIGLAFGYIAKIAFAGLIMAASLVGYQMGFGTANLFIPDAEQALDGFTAFHRMIVMLVFLGLNLHHLFLQGMGLSFRAVPLGTATLHAALPTNLVRLTADIFVSALQLAAPILIALLLTMAALGLIARTVPQLNVFTLSFPLSFIIGLMVYIASFPFLSPWIRQHFGNTTEQILIMLRSFAG